jgi:uncharacterized protein (DUF39 family)
VPVISYSEIVCGLNRGRDRQKGIQFRIDAQGDLTDCPKSRSIESTIDPSTVKK